MDLIDPYGRTVRDLRISITDRCNFRCTYCMPAEGMKWLPRADVLSYEEMRRLAAVCVGHFGVDGIRITGGEPTMRAHLPVLIEKLAQLVVPEGASSPRAGRPIDLAITTNGATLRLIADELREVKAMFAVPRRSEIVDWEGDLDDEDLIEREDMVVTITSGGYIKRTPLAEFRSQNRGGKGLSAMETKEDDVVTTLFVANTHTALLFFTTDGMVYQMKCWRLPLAGRTAKEIGRAHV